CAAAGRSDLLDTFAPAEEICSNPAEATALKAELVRLIGSRDLAWWTHVLAKADVPFAPVNRPVDIANEPHFAARGMTGATSMPIPGGLGGQVVLTPAPR